MVEHRAYNPEYFEIMNAVTALAVACWLEVLATSELRSENLTDYEEATAFFDKLLVQESQVVIEPVKEHIHAQFVKALRNTIDFPFTNLEKITAELLNNFMVKTMGQVHSKMREAPRPFSTTTGGFGSGVHTLLITEILERLYSPEYFPSFKAASTIAKLEFYSFTSSALIKIGVIDEKYALAFTDRSFAALDLEDSNATNGLSTEAVKRWGYSPQIEYSGCVGLYPPSREFRTANAALCENIPTQSAIAQLRKYIIPTVDNLITWAKQKGGTESLQNSILPIDLGLLNGTHPNLPKYPRTGQAPQSLIDKA